MNRKPTTTKEKSKKILCKVKYIVWLNKEIFIQRKQSI